MNTLVSDFKPSDVVPVFLNSIFQNTEKECLAAHIITFLSNNGNNWDSEVQVSAFFEHTRTHKFEISIYNDPFANPILCNGFINAMHQLVGNGYVEWTDELKKFKVRTKLIEFYCAYSK